VLHAHGKIELDFDGATRIVSNVRENHKTQHDKSLVAPKKPSRNVIDRDERIVMKGLVATFVPAGRQKKKLRRVNFSRNVKTKQKS
jgi:hypothetical protein